MPAMREWISQIFEVIITKIHSVEDSDTPTPKTIKEYEENGQMNLDEESKVQTASLEDALNKYESELEIKN